MVTERAADFGAEWRVPLRRVFLLARHSSLLWSSRTRATFASGDGGDPAHQLRGSGDQRLPTGAEKLPFMRHPDDEAMLVAMHVLEEIVPISLAMSMTWMRSTVGPQRSSMSLTRRIQRTILSSAW